jgi:hypothetical protein
MSKKPRLTAEDKRNALLEIFHESSGVKGTQMCAHTHTHIYTHGHTHTHTWVMAAIPELVQLVA